MAWTAADLATIEAAMVSGERVIQYSDGRRVEYRSVEELKVARAMVQETLNQSGTPTIRRIQIYTSKGL